MCEFKVIPLTRGKEAIVDVEDYEALSGINWHASWSGYGFYAATSMDGKPLYMHRFLINVPPGKQIDHINGNSLDNRKSNLRICSNQENSWNQKKKRSEVKYKGIRQFKDGGPWYARISSSGKERSLGSYPTAKEAALAYDQAAREMHGAFARLNFPGLDICPVRRVSRRSDREQDPNHIFSLYRGVCWNKSARKWQAQFSDRKSGELKFVGYYHSEEDAARAYDSAALSYYSKTTNTVKKMKLNFPQSSHLA